MASFGTKAINYLEEADNGFKWNVRYDLSFQNSEVLTTLKIDLVGDPPGLLRALSWYAGINDTWNDKVCFSDGSRLYEVKLKADFVDGGAHHIVDVTSGSGATDMNNWYTDDSGATAAHEAGHMFGNFDEYAGGATNNGFTTTGTLMSDLTPSGFEDYFWTQEYYTELYGGMSLSTVRANTGTASANTLTGGSGMDGLYGMGGNDTISGGGGSDLIDGGTGVDRMTGGSGSDIFDLDNAMEIGNSNAAREVIMDFTKGVDRIDLSGMDASAELAGNNAFSWLGTSTFGTGAGGEVRYAWFDLAGTAYDHTIVYGDTDSDTDKEFMFELRGLVTLGSADFYL
jgi:hemolysin type calcium-binding protein